LLYTKNKGKDTTVKKQYRFSSLALATGCILALVGGNISVAHAQMPEPHPHYLRALSDLRAARAWLTALGENNVMGREMDAVTNIDKAIADIKQAAIDDGKDLNDHPPIDAHLKHRGRLHRALALINSARKDLRYAEGNPAALGWRKGALKHVNDAARADQQAIRDVRNDS
jgi:hypothetical protein